MSSKSALPKELLPFVLPKKGELFVSRMETPAKQRGIVLPMISREITRAAEATVVVDNSALGLLPGTSVFLASSVQKKITFGLVHTVELWICTPRQIQAVVLESPDRGIEHMRNAFGGYTGIDLEELSLDEVWFDEGDLEGPQ